MEIYRRTTTLTAFNEPEKQVFCQFIKEVRYWEKTNEVDLMIQSGTSTHHLSRFNSLPTGLFSDDLNELKVDIEDLNIEAFWDEYSGQLTGIWHKDLSVIL